MERYLLEGLDGNELAGFEDRMVSDEAFFQQLEFMEDQLIEAYVRGRLAPSDRERFEGHFMLSPRRRRQVELHLALEKRLASHTPAAVEGESGGIKSLVAWIARRQFPIAAYAVGVALAVVNLGVFWRLQDERAAIAEQNRGNTGGVLQLLPGTMRGTDESVLRLPAGWSTVALELRPSFAVVPGRYSVLVKKGQGEVVWKSEWTQLSGKDTGSSISVAIPGGVLQEGRYEVELSRVGGEGGSAPSADYRFTVAK